MEKMRLGRTNMNVCRTGMGCLPLQRISQKEAVSLIRRAFDNGIDFFDTARNYTDSESKVGEALKGHRSAVVIATKSTAKTGKELLSELETSLKELQTDVIDLYQFHVAQKVHRPEDEDGLYAAALAAKEKGLIRHIGITFHRLPLALDAAQSGLYETVQFPLSYLSSPEDLELIELCRKHDVGLIAMKSMAGGLLTDARAAFTFQRQYDNLLPIWGVQREAELDEFIALEKNPPQMDALIQQRIDADREALSSGFCRGCGYCLPCPANIEIAFSARMPLVLRRMDPEFFLTPEWREKMARIPNCILCGACKTRCPYELDTPELLKKAYEDYVQFASEWDAAH